MMEFPKHYIPEIKACADFVKGLYEQYRDDEKFTIDKFNEAFQSWYASHSKHQPVIDFSYLQIYWIGYGIFIHNPNLRDKCLFQKNYGLFVEEMQNYIYQKEVKRDDKRKID